MDPDFETRVLRSRGLDVVLRLVCVVLALPMLGVVLLVFVDPPHEDARTLQGILVVILGVPAVVLLMLAVRRLFGWQSARWAYVMAGLLTLVFPVMLAVELSAPIAARRAIRAWPSTTAEVVSTRLVHPGKGWNPREFEVVYRYSVSGRSHRVVSYRRYPGSVGDRVTMHYDPADPDSAALPPDWNDMLVAASIGTALLAVSAWLFYKAAGRTAPTEPC